nr:Lsr2 family protein [Actinoplanes digitatis]
MAKTIVTLLTDDIDGSEADRTIEFGLDGVSYTIDLSEKNTGKLRKALDPYLAVASRVGRSGAQRSHPVPRHGCRTRPDEPRAEPGDPGMGRQERLRRVRAWSHPELDRRSVPQQALTG